MFEISPSPVCAVIVTQAVMSVPAFVMKIFEPSITQRPSRSAARVRVAPASEPAPARGPGARRPGVRAPARLRQPDGAQPTARRQVRQPFAPLLLLPEGVD